MNMDVFNNIEETVTDIKHEIKEKSHSEEIELATKLNAIEEYSIDRFEGDYAILENRQTNEIKQVKKDMLPENIKEGSIVQYVNGKYIYDEAFTKEKTNRIQDRMNKLWK